MSPAAAWTVIGLVLVFLIGPVLVIIGVSCGVVSALVSCAVRLPRPRAQPETAPL